MPIQKGTKPKTSNWVGCEEYEFDAAIRSMRSADLHLFKTTRDNQTIFRNIQGDIVARQYRYQTGVQCLIWRTMSEHLPKRRFEQSKEASIYA